MMGVAGTDSLFYRVYIHTGSGSGSRTDSSVLAVLDPVLRLTQIIGHCWSGYRTDFDVLDVPGPVLELLIFFLLFFLFFSFFCVKAPWWRGGIKKKCLKASWQRCYYPHRLRDALTPVCRIFFIIDMLSKFFFGIFFK